MHGKLSRIHHTGKSVFRGLNNDFLATRYHSLTIAPESMPAVAGSHRDQRRRRDPGRDAQDPSRAWRAVPSRKHRLARTATPCCRISSTSRGRPCRHERRGFRLALKRVASGDTLDAETVGARLRRHHGRRSQRDAHRRASSPRMAVRKPTVDEIVGAVRAMRGAMKSIERQSRCHRSVRHRRRRHRHAQHLDRLRRSWSRPAACRSPSMATATCRRRAAPPTVWKRWA